MIHVHVEVVRSTNIVTVSNYYGHPHMKGCPFYCKITRGEEMELVEIKQELEKMTNRLADFRGSL